MSRIKITKDFIDEVTFYINNNETSMVELCKIYNVSKNTLYYAIDKGTLSKLKASSSRITTEIKLELLRLHRENPLICISDIAKALDLDPSSARAIVCTAKKNTNYEAILKLKAKSVFQSNLTFEPKVTKVKKEKKERQIEENKFRVIHRDLHTRIHINTSDIRNITYKDGEMIITIHYNK